MTHFSEILAGYERFMRRCDYSPRTIAARMTLARKVMRQHAPADLTPDLVADLITRSELSRWSKVTYFSHLKDFCGYLLAVGYVEDDPMRGIDRPKSPKSLPRPLSEADIARVFAAPPCDDMRDWMTLALFAGLRAHEIAKVRGRDVTSDGVRVVGKGQVEAVLPCHSEVARIAARRDTAGYWFPGGDSGHIYAQRISLRVGSYFDTFGIEGSIHRLRHSYGTRLLRAGVNIRRVQTLMRHANLETTAIYTAVDENELKSAIDLLPGLPPVA
jgi:integrase/recombinase XerD